MASDGDNSDANDQMDLIRAAMAEVAKPDVLEGSASELISFSEAPGQVIDRYRLLEEIGEGGMGVVWRAEQLAPVERVVALKVVKLGMDTRQVTARFELERAALARLNHPNIATVLDGGTTVGGRPYFAMEFVPGASIIAASDKMRLDVQARIRLMLEVCGAIEHAHGQGIIHRDIKSSNVLLPGYAEQTRIGEPLVPKVIDFGIAKAVGEGTGATSLLTEQRQILGTLESMAPEQAAMGQIDERTDVYGLGVLLFELLAGCTPFAHRATEGGGYEKALRLIREERPPFASSVGMDATVAARRSATLPELRKVLARDMDWVIARALEKEPSRRYPTVAALREDLERYLEGRPVEARPPSWMYLSGKFVQRHRGLTLGVSAAMLALLVGLVATVVALGRAQSAERETRRTLYGAESLLACDAVLARGGYARVKEFCDRWVGPKRGNRDWRGWEWYYLDSTTRPDVLSIESESTPCGAAWHPNGEQIAVARYLGVDVYNSRSGERLGGLGWEDGAGPALLEGIAWDPSATRVVASGMGGMIAVEPMTETLLWQYPARYISGPVWLSEGDRIIGFGSEEDQDDLLFEFDPVSGEVTRRVAGGFRWIGSFEMSRDGRQLTSAKATGRCVILDGATYEPLFSLSDHISVLTAARWNKDETSLATAGFDGRVRVWDVDKRTVSLAIDARSEPVRGLDWHPNGRWIAAGSDDKQINIWNVESGEHRAELSGHSERVDRVAWSPTGDRLASTSQDGTVRIWNFDVPSPHRFIVTSSSGERSRHATLTWSPQEDSILVGSPLGASTVRLDDDQVGERIYKRDRSNAAASADGRFVATATDAAGGDSLELNVWDPSLEAPAQCSWFFPWVQNYNHVRFAWHPSLSRLAFSYGGMIRVVDLVDGSPPTEIYRGPGGEPVMDIQWDAAGERLATVSARGQLSVLDPVGEAGGGPAHLILQGPDAAFRSVGWSPDGKRLAFSSGAGDVFLMSEDGTELKKLTGHSTSVEAVAWHPSGDRVASASRDGTVLLWDADSGRLVAKLVEGDPVLALSWSAAGTRLAAITDLGLLHIWDASISLGLNGSSEE